MEFIVFGKMANRHHVSVGMISTIYLLGLKWLRIVQTHSLPIYDLFYRNPRETFKGDFRQEGPKGGGDQ
jgi:hypothetical protein